MTFVNLMVIFNGIDSYGNIKCKPKEFINLKNHCNIMPTGTFKSNILVHFVNSKKYH